MRPSATLTHLGLAPCLLLVHLGVASAELSTITLDHPVAPWDQRVRASIHVDGCTGPASPPVLRYTPAQLFLDIDVANCFHDVPVDPLPSYDATIELPSLSPGDYLVRVVDPSGSVNPPWPSLAEAPLAAYRHGDMSAELAAPAIPGEPVQLTIHWLEQGCFGVQQPTVEGRVITATYDDGCPLLPPGGGPTEQTFDLGALETGDYEVRLFDGTGLGITTTRPGLTLFSFTVADPVVDPCPDPTALCLGNGRFLAHATWRDFTGRSGDGMPIRLGEASDSGLFWFFWEGNVELTVKVLDGCHLSGHYWVFVSSATSVEYALTITDTVTGETWLGGQPAHTLAPLVADTHALSCDG